MKKITPLILITAVLGTVLAPAIAGAESYEINVLEKSDPGFSWESCFPGVGDFTKCIGLISYWVLFKPTAVILWLGGQIFNGSMHFSIDRDIFSSDLITNGWKATRDFANMFFIFILLYIAIATILQLGGYGIKDLLVKVLIVALLVNFSLLITKVVIDASNVLAWEFYNNMTNNLTDAGKTISTTTTSLFGKNARDISSVFIAGFNPQNLLSTKSFEDWQGIEGEDIAIIVLFLCGALMNLVAAFVLFAGAIFFVIRIAVLWLIMMLAPLAFLAMALPAASGYAKKWWDKLFNQAFFAPAFLFLIYLVSKLVRGAPPNAAGEQKGILAVIFESMEENSRGLSGIEGFLASLLVILIHFVVMVTLMVGSLIIAKQLGAYGSGAVMKWGDSARKWGQGYAGKISRRGAGHVAEGMLKRAEEKPEGLFAKSIQTMPLATRGLARMSSWKAKQDKEKEKKYEKIYGSYSDVALKQMAKREKFGATDVTLETIGQGPRISDEKMEAIQKILKKREIEKQKKATKEETIKNESLRLEQIDAEINAIENINPGITIGKEDIYEGRIVTLESEIAGLQGKTSDDATKRRAQLIVEKRQIEKTFKKINDLEKEKKEIKEKQEKREEMGTLEEKISKFEKGLGEKKEEKKT